MKAGKKARGHRKDRRPEHKTDRRPDLPHRMSRLGLTAAILAGALVWLSLLAFPDEPKVNLDSSWQQALIYASRHHLQAGVDYAFTYGPLGMCVNSIISWPDRFFAMPYDHDLFYRQIAWETAANAFIAAIIMMAVLKTRGAARRLLFLALALVMIPISKDVVYLFALVAATALIVERDHGGRVLTAFTLAFMAVVALMKFTLLMMAVVCAAAIAAGLLRRSKAGAAAVVGGFAALFAAAWVICGQSLANLPAYFSTSREIANGYSEAMVGKGPWDQVILGCGMLGVAAALGAISLLSKRRLTRLVTVLVVGAALFMAWKAGFVRHDLHAFIFFVCAAAIPFLIPAPDGRFARVIFATLVVAEFAMGVDGMLESGKLMKFGLTPQKSWTLFVDRIERNVFTLAWPETARQERQAQFVALEKSCALPRIRAAVGNAAIDVFSYDQQILFLNHLNWRGRPVFQSYSAYTQRLLALNGRFYEGREAPEFVLFKVQAIDGRFPTMEDSAALVSVLRRYEPVLAEKGYLVLRRRASTGAPGPAGAAGAPLVEQIVDLNRAIDLSTLPDVPLALSLDMQYSPLGRLRKFLFRAPVVTMEVRTGTGAKLKFRLPPDMAKKPFIINPFIMRQDDLAGWYTGKPRWRIKSLWVSLSWKDLKYFEPGVRVKVEKIDLKPPALPEAVKREISGTAAPVTGTAR